MVNILGFGLRQILNISTVPWKIYDIDQVIWFIYLFVYKVKIIYCIHNTVRLLQRLSEMVYSNVSIVPGKKYVNKYELSLLLNNLNEFLL